MSDAHELVRYAIDDDRKLLELFGLSLSEAATFLGRSRQALHHKLGGKHDAPDPYFSLGDIAFLVSAARSKEKVFTPQDLRDIVDYVTRTRGNEGPAYRLFMQLLEEKPVSLDVNGAAAIILLLPGFAELRSEQPEVASGLLSFVRDLPEGTTRPIVFVLSTSRTQAAMAARWLGIEDDDNCFGHDLADHYGPTIVIYRRGGRGKANTALPYILTDDGTFKESPRFRHTIIADGIAMMLPKEAEKRLQEAA